MSFKVLYRSFCQTSLKNAKRYGWRMKDQLAKESAGRVPVPETQGELLWGFHPTTAAINANRRRVFAAFVQHKLASERCVMFRELCAAHQVPVQVVHRAVMDEMAANHPHQGVCLDVSPRTNRYIDIDTDITSADLVDPATGLPVVWVLPYRVVDTMNMGAILRSSHFFGVAKIVLPLKYSAGLNAVVSKASAGAAEVLEILTLRNPTCLLTTLQRWRSEGGRVVGSTSDANHPRRVPLHGYTVDTPTLLLIGNEAEGLPPEVCHECDALLHIRSHMDPNHWHATSLNVSVATGILLHSIMTNRKPVKT